MSTKEKRTKRAAATAENGHAGNGEELSRRDGGPEALTCRACRWCWTGHARQKTCPKCGSPDLKRIERPTRPAKHEAGALAELLDVGKIDASPFQTRKHFDAATLAALAASIGKVGVLQPILVRPAAGGRYELIAGERRLRAAKAARVRHIPGRIVDVTDEEAIEINARENLDRDDLDPIERALTFQQLLERGGLTQEALAKRFGLSQETVSNSVRLLTLPEAWQQKLITREISPSHARELLPWCDLPALCEKVLKLKLDELGSLKDFQETLGGLLRECSRPLNPQSLERDRPLFKPTQEQLARLDVRMTPTRWGDGRERRAFNVECWTELQSAARKKQRAKRHKLSSTGAQTPQRDWDAVRQTADYHKLWYLERANWTMAQIADRLEPEKHNHQVLRLFLGGALNARFLLLTLLDDPQQLSDEERLATVFAVKGDKLTEFAFNLVRVALATAKNVFDLRLCDAARDWLAKELHVTLDAWAPSAGFVDRFEGKQRTRLLADIFDADARDEITAAGGTTAAILERWPKEGLPDLLVRAESNGELAKAARKDKKKARR